MSVIVGREGGSRGRRGVLTKVLENEDQRRAIRGTGNMYDEGERPGEKRTKKVTD